MTRPIVYSNVCYFRDLTTVKSRECINQMDVEILLTILLMVEITFLSQTEILNEILYLYYDERRDTRWNLTCARGKYGPFSITKRYNIDIYISNIAQSTEEYFPIFPSCLSNMENKLFQYWSLVTIQIQYIILNNEILNFNYSVIPSNEGYILQYTP